MSSGHSRREDRRLSRFERAVRPDAPQRLLLGFGTGHFAKSLIWSFSDLLFGYFAHVHMGVPSSETGWIVFVSLVYSGGLDIAAAALVIGFPGQERRVPHLQFVGAAVTAVGAALLFAPLSIPAGLMFAWMLTASLLFRTGFALYDVSQNALVSLLPRDDADARRYVTVRTSLSYVAKVLVALASFTVIGSGERQGAALMTILPIAVLAVLAAYPMSRHRVQPLAPVEGKAAGGSRPPFALILPVLVAVAAQGCLLGVVGRFLPFARDPQTGESIGAMLALASVIGGIFGPLLVDRLLRHRRGCAIANVGFTAACVLCALAILSGQTAVQLVAAAALFSIGGGGISVLVWNQLSGAVRAHARATGRRTDLASFALLTATVKLGAGGTGLFLGRWLDGFETRSAEAILWIGGATIAGGMISIVAMALGERRLQRLQ